MTKYEKLVEDEVIRDLILKEEMGTRIILKSILERIYALENKASK